MQKKSFLMKINFHTELFQVILMQKNKTKWHNTYMRVQIPSSESKQNKLVLDWFLLPTGVVHL